VESLCTAADVFFFIPCVLPLASINIAVPCFRNKQLRAHLVSEVSELEAGSEGNAAQLLCQRERELEQKCEEINQLQHQLDATKTVSKSLQFLLFFFPLHVHGLLFHKLFSW
jgi:hypothetical protein